MTLCLPDGTPFTTGSAPYECRSAAAEDRFARFFVPVTIEGIGTDAVVDTGGLYLVMQPALAQAAKLTPANALGTDAISIRGVRVRGHVHRVMLTLVASVGESMRSEVTGFVPSLDPHTLWDLPNYLGWHGCMERFCFAINPATETFYFGVSEPAL